jgi:hypothetical protein
VATRCADIALRGARTARGIAASKISSRAIRAPDTGEKIPGRIHRAVSPAGDVFAAFYGGGIGRIGLGAPADRNRPALRSFGPHYSGPSEGLLPNKYACAGAYDHLKPVTQFNQTPANSPGFQ